MQILEEQIREIATQQIELRPLRVVIAGGNGHVGNVLAPYFHSRGHSVVVLARTTHLKPWPMVAWDGEHLREWMKELEGADAVINLVGRSVNCRYSAAHRREILESRVKSTRLLGVAIAKLKNPPLVWLNASTATIYRHALDRAMDERTGEIGGHEAGAPATWKFSIEVATKWEESFFAACLPKTRRVALRSAMIMSPEHGGIFDTLLRLVRLGLGGPAGSGTQYVSWIHEQDFARAIEFLVAHQEIEGAVNVAAPEPLPNSEFMLALRKAWGARIGLPAREWMLRIGAVLLRTETELILKSRRVVPGRLLDAGFRFQFPCWPVAAEGLVRRWRLRAT
ncbi:MAG TPA: TIGR01777 family oxidoreductase [Candidatus Acidoferrum sp.]|nr:TIGR01777 family oxidoreductase [Candidatus Acidoferrum sp.]